MHPANSVILFTTLSGLGFGLIFWLGLGFGPSGAVAGPLTCILALALSAAGLLASTFHLGNPQRFLKAFSQVGSSWLSREGVVSVALMSVLFLYAALWFLGGEPMRALGVIGSVLAVIAVTCTAMIYAQLKTVPRWSNPLTLPMFLGFSAAGGAIATALASVLSGEPPSQMLGMGLLVASGAAYAYRRFSQLVTMKSVGHTPETATGLGDLGKVRLLESPHSQPNYLMKEMVYRVGRKHAEKLAIFTVIIGLFAPLFLFVGVRFLEAPAVVALGLALALALHVAGALTSRWLFFAEAEHVVGLYYGKR